MQDARRLEDQFTAVRGPPAPPSHRSNLCSAQHHPPQSVKDVRSSCTGI
jgi:hypothetical protein